MYYPKVKQTKHGKLPEQMSQRAMTHGTSPRPEATALFGVESEVFHGEDLAGKQVGVWVSIFITRLALHLTAS